MNETLWDFAGMSNEEIRDIIRNAAIEWCRKRSDLHHISFDRNWILTRTGDIGIYVRFTTPALSEYLPDRTEQARGPLADAWKWHDYFYEIAVGKGYIRMHLTVHAFDDQDATTIEKFRKFDEIYNGHNFEDAYNRNNGHYIWIWSTAGKQLTEFNCEDEVFLYLYENWDELMAKEKHFLDSISSAP